MSGRHSGSPQHDSSEFIGEIVGVRGLALALVVLFHLFGAGRVSGGVDVFLFISAFLLTGSLVRRVDRGGPFLANQYGRMAVRLVPAAIVVLVGVLVATVLLAPSTQWLQNGRELIASALYYENWELISSQLAYGAAGPQTSPLQHFWSMSVQGQFFVAWPLLVAVVAAITARRLPVRRVLFVVTALLTAASFAYAMLLHGQDQQVAYFDSFARFWELGAGALLALSAHHLRIGRAWSIAAVWTGLAMIVACGFLIDGGSAFPGPLTLWPLAGTALIIVGSGVRTRRFGPDRLLDTAPLRFIARISYPLYLWHWPILIFWLMYFDRPSVGPRSAAAILLISVVLAWLTQRFVAEPAIALRSTVSTRSMIAAPLAAIAVVVLIVGAGVVRVQAWTDAQIQQVRASTAEVTADGARALDADGSGSVNTAAFVPAAAAAGVDRPAPLSWGCVQGTGDVPGRGDVKVCESDVEDPTRTIVMSGGSHVMQWYEAMEGIAARNGWALVLVDKDGCRLISPEGAREISPYDACVEWNEKVVDEIAAIRPDALLTVGSQTPNGKRFTEEVMLDEQVEVWRELDAAGIPTIAIRDTPRFEWTVPTCVSEHPDDLSACGRARDDIFAAEDPLLSAADVPESTVAIDMTDSFCTDRCEPVVGDVLVYRDRDHFSATYGRTLEEPLERALRAQAPWLF
ncbi:acyltransferase family protein [Agromyces sp. SYSU T00194]|uniref:acyltransferase family protein n=1 Tax=Agromyces chitinivorans TaxID=3158560 RepID=UPI0033982309